MYDEIFLVARTFERIQVAAASGATWGQTQEAQLNATFDRAICSAVGR